MLRAHWRSEIAAPAQPQVAASDAPRADWRSRLAALMKLIQSGHDVHSAPARCVEQIIFHLGTALTNSSASRVSRLASPVQRQALVHSSSDFTSSRASRPAASFGPDLIGRRRSRERTSNTREHTPTQWRLQASLIRKTNKLNSARSINERAQGAAREFLTRANLPDWQLK